MSDPRSSPALFRSAIFLYVCPLARYPPLYFIPAFTLVKIKPVVDGSLA